MLLYVILQSIFKCKGIKMYFSHLSPWTTYCPSGFGEPSVFKTYFKKKEEEKTAAQKRNENLTLGTLHRSTFNLSFDLILIEKYKM